MSAAAVRRAPRRVVIVGAGMAAAAGLLGAVGLRNPRRKTCAARCPGGQLVGAPEEVALEA